MKQYNQSQIEQIIHTALRDTYAQLKSFGVVETDVFYDARIQSNVIEMHYDDGNVGHIVLHDDEFSLNMSAETIGRKIVGFHSES